MLPGEHFITFTQSFLEIQCLTRWNSDFFFHIKLATLHKSWSTYRPRELEGNGDLPGIVVPVLDGFLAAPELKSIPTDNLSSFRAVGALSIGRDLRLVFL